MTLVLCQILNVLSSHAENKKWALNQDLYIEQISPNVYVHVSNLQFDNGKSYPCNGLLYINNEECLVVDTPVNDTLTALLFDWVEKEKGWGIGGIVVTHFHIDCTGGLNECHRRGYLTYSHSLTSNISHSRGEVMAKEIFDSQLKVKVGKTKVNLVYYGEGHTNDNIVVWVPKEKLLFGGCLIKEVDGKTGNLEDANINEWANTVRRVKKAYPLVKTVVPGHGEFGDDELLTYTIEMFSD